MVSTYLEGVVETLRVYLMKGRLVGVRDQFLDLGENVSVEVKVELGLLHGDHFCEVLPAELVAIFKLAVVVSLLLNRIISQMHSNICHIVERVLAATRSDVPILIAVALKTAIDATQQAEAPEIKLALVH